MADTVRLEITVDDKGSPVIKTLTENLDKLKNKNAETADASKKFGEAANKATEILGQMGMQSGSLVTRMASMMGPTALLTATIGGGLVAAAYGAANAFQQFAFQVRDLSYLSGGSARDTAILITALEDLSVDAGTVEAGINRMSQAAAKGDPALAQLGVTMRDDVSGNVKDGLTLFYETIDALGKMTNEVERNQLAQSIFGRGWTSLVPVIAKGSQHLKELGAENAALGKTMDEAGVKRAEEFKEALNNLKDVGEGLAVSWGGKLIPILTEAAKAAMEFLTGTTPLTRALKDEELAARLAGDGIYALDESERRLAASSRNVIAITEAKKKSTGELSAELERRLKYETQLANLEAQVAAAKAGTERNPEARAMAEQAAAVAQADSKLKATRNELETARKNADPKERGRLDNLEREAVALRNNEVAKAAMEAEDKKRAERIRIAGLDKGMAEGEGNIGLGLSPVDQAAMAERQKALDEFYRLQKYNEDQAAADHLALVRAGTYDYDNYEEGRLATYQATEEEIAAGRLAGEQRNAERLVREVKNEANARQDLVDQDRAALAQRLNSTTNFYDKVAISMRISTRTYESENDRMLRITDQFAKTATQSLDDFFFSAVTGKFESLGDVVKNFGYSLLRIGTQEASKSIISSIFGGGSGGGTNWWDLGKTVVSGATTAYNAVSSFLGGFDTGAWKVPDGKTGAAPTTTGSRWTKGTTGTKAAGWAVLHPGEMVVPPEEAELLRQLVERFGGGGFGDLSAILTGEGGGGRGGGQTAGGQYGAMTSAERSTLSGFGYSTRAMGVGLGLAGMSTLGTSVLGMGIASALGIDTMLGPENLAGYKQMEEAQFTSIRDYFGVYAEQAARQQDLDNANRAAVQNATDLKSAMEAADAEDAAAGARSAEASNESSASTSAGVTGATSEAQDSASRTAAEAQDSAMGGGTTGGTTGGSQSGGESDSNDGADSGNYASGGLFKTRGRMRLTVGEAGTEQVAVLKNPRELVAGGQGVTVNVYNSGVIGNQLPDALVREFQRELDRRASRRVTY